MRLIHQKIRRTTKPRSAGVSERGQAMVEFALIVPIFLLLVFGSLEFGIAYFNYQQVGTAADEGARAAAVNRTNSPAVAARDAARKISPNLNLTDSEITVTPAGTSLAYPGTVTVTVAVPQSIRVFGAAWQVVTLTATATDRLER